MVSECIIDGGIVNHPIGHEPMERAIHRRQQFGNDRGILGVTIGEGIGVDPARFIDTDVELFPLPTIFLAMFLAVPLALSADLQAGAVDDEGDGSDGKVS